MRELADALPGITELVRTLVDRVAALEAAIAHREQDDGPRAFSAD